MRHRQTIDERQDLIGKDATELSLEDSVEGIASRQMVERVSQMVGGRDAVERVTGRAKYTGDLELPGITIRPIREITGDSLFCEIFFDDVKVPVGDRLGDEGNGWLVSMGALGKERVGSAGQAISMANELRALLETAKAVNPDALRDPAIRDRVARLHTQIEFTRLLIARALTKVLRGEKGFPEVPLSKLQWGSISLCLAELALDVLGPTSVLTKGAPGAVDGGVWARNYVWQRYTTIGAGPTEVQKNIIADRALRLER